MALTNFQIERYFDKKIKDKLTLYSQLLDAMRQVEGSQNQDMTSQLTAVKKEIDMLIEIINDVGFKNILQRYDIHMGER